LKVANFNPSFVTAVEGDPIWNFEFRRDLRHQKTRVPQLSCSIVCVILCLAISIGHRLVTDGRTDGHKTAYTALA